jgi:light-regulated signal transduction histidine kinase (bacteriophytochrome)
VGIKRDISQRKRAERELLSRVEDLESVHRMTVSVTRAGSLEELYDAALLTMGERLAAERAAVLLLDDDGAMRFKAWRGLSEAYRRAVEGHNPWPAGEPQPAPVLVADAEAEPSLAALRPVLRAQGVRALAFIPLVYESRLLGKLLLYHAGPHEFTPREVRLAQTIANTLAFAIERRRADERLAKKVRELARSNADLENFAYVTSHDLKEPLRGISSIVGFLREDLGDRLDGAGLERIARLNTLSRRMYELLDSLLEYSRVGQGEYRVREVSLATLAAETVDTLRARIAAEGAVVEVEPGLPTLRCDPLRVTQVLSNLVVNGLKYNASSPKRVTIGWDAAQHAVRVQDNGIGIPSGQHEAIFRMFKRLHPGEAYGGGTGVGLAIVKKIVERHGGRVWVESAPGLGSTFWFTLGEPGAGPGGAPDEA